MNNCADFYEMSLVKDIAKDEYRELELPAPRKLGECLNCKAALMSQCYIEDCLCSKNFPKYCCLCVGLNIEHPDPSEEFFFG
jgi:hypothetical protein